MTREFIMTGEFDKAWSDMGLNDCHLKELQEMILSDPEVGQVVTGTGGLRKMRFAINSGKSGGARVLYVDLVLSCEIYLITAYPKSKTENITMAQKNAIKKMIARIKSTAKTGGNL